MYYIPTSSVLLAGTGVWKISSVACGFSFIKIDYSEYPKSLISRINDIYVFFNGISLYFIEKTNFILNKPFVLLQSHLLLC